MKFFVFKPNDTVIIQTVPWIFSFLNPRLEIKSFLKDVKWCLNASWGFKGLTYWFWTLCASEEMTAVFGGSEWCLKCTAVHVHIVDRLYGFQGILWLYVGDVGTGTGALRGSRSL